MTRNKAYLVEYQDFNGSPVAFGGLQHFNLFSVSQLCDKKNKVLFTDTECLVLSPDFKLPNENQVLLRVPRQNNMYSFNLENIVSSGGLACLIAKAIIDESNKWYRSNARTPQQNRVAERKNMTLVKAARTMLANSFLPNTFWAKAHVTTENKANIIAGPKEANNSVEEKNRDEKLIRDIGSKTNKELVDQEDQVFLEELKRLKRQEKEADDAADTFRKTFAKSTKDLLLQAGAAIASSTNYVNTASTTVNTASIIINTASILVNAASPLRNVNAARPSYPDLSSSSYDDEGVMADFTNLESTMNIEPKNISQALKDESWVNAMQEELMQFKTQQVYILVDLPFGRRQEEGIDYDEVFAHIARIKAIEIFLAFASYIRFIVYQMDVKSAFLYGKIDQEVYISQPIGFIDSKFPKKVYKVKKALYGLHQAPRAWYATLSTFLVESRYRRGLIDKTLFIKKDKKDIMLVKVYVDDIIFCSTKKSLCDEFEALMKSRFQISSMGGLTFFLRLQAKHKEDRIFISQDKYVAEILKKFDFMSVKTASTPIKTKPDIMYAVCACSRFQVTLKTSYLYDVKRIFRYLKGQQKLGLWYPRESAFDLKAYSYSDYARANLDRKSTTGGCQFLGRRLIS
uniref:Reverse transcriptase Ty1/copia-type domain-containing protein n=1 Tax=Tanacetum cinerariifolium TaxID=118510 RepID=A0A6L2L7T2_TANCI|nr:hypothetical protein [Tanacetum cinerariifolium]